MADARLVWRDINGGDLKLKNGFDLDRDDGLVTSVLISLFSDARAPSTDVLPPGETSVRGYWPDDEEDRFGSLLWLLGREKVTQETAERAREYAQQALNWLVEDDIAESVTVVATIPATYTILLDIEIKRGTATESKNLWDNLGDVSESIQLSETIKRLDINITFI